MKTVITFIFGALIGAAIVAGQLGCSTIGNGKLDTPVEITVNGTDNLGNAYEVTLGPDGVTGEIRSVVGGNLYELAEDGFTVTVPTSTGPKTITIKRVK
jgi:hypothetical protein